MEDFLTWTDTSAIKKHVMAYSEQVSVFSLGFCFVLELSVWPCLSRYIWFVMSLQNTTSEVNECHLASGAKFDPLLSWRLKHLQQNPGGKNTLRLKHVYGWTGN